MSRHMWRSSKTISNTHPSESFISFYSRCFTDKLMMMCFLFLAFLLSVRSPSSIIIWSGYLQVSSWRLETFITPDELRAREVFFFFKWCFSTASTSNRFLSISESCRERSLSLLRFQRNRGRFLCTARTRLTKRRIWRGRWGNAESRMKRMWHKTWRYRFLRYSRRLRRMLWARRSPRWSGTRPTPTCVASSKIPAHWAARVGCWALFAMAPTVFGRRTMESEFIQKKLIKSTFAVPKVAVELTPTSPNARKRLKS